LIAKAIAHIDDKLIVTQLKYIKTTGEQDTVDTFTQSKTKTEELSIASSTIKYDLIGKIATGTTLTRRTIVKILQGIKPAKFMYYQANPEEFINKVINLINEQKAALTVEHITYNVTEGTYDSNIFIAEKNKAEIKNAVEANKHVQDYVFFDSEVEKKFAEEIDIADEVCVYAKLPRGFNIPTPMGNYNPDWAIAFNEGTVKHIYFIAETKGTLSSLELRPLEKAKIDCAKKLFNGLSTNQVKYHEVTDYQQLLSIVQGM
jgi:type III restriction enzyme